MENKPEGMQLLNEVEGHLTPKQFNILMQFAPSNFMKVNKSGQNALTAYLAHDKA
jgi:hypothetical protein